MNLRLLAGFFVVGATLLSAPDWVRAAEPAADRSQPTTAVEALAPFRDFVGKWRGVGQPQRGSTRGAWVEHGEWSWQFDDGTARLAFVSPQAKYIQSATLGAGEKAGAFSLGVQVAAADGATATSARQVIYHGQIDGDGRLVLVTTEPGEALPARITIGLVAAGDRLVMFLERKSPAGERYSRLAEVGYTREGSQFGKGNTQPECVVTGGHGSISVEHQGKTYYVCCGGCKDLFDEDPEKTLAEYRERKAAEKMKTTK